MLASSFYRGKESPIKSYLFAWLLLNLSDSFAFYDKERLIKLAKFYPQDFTSTNLVQLFLQLNIFIVDVCNDTRFRKAKNLRSLSLSNLLRQINTIALNLFICC